MKIVFSGKLRCERETDDGEEQKTMYYKTVNIEYYRVFAGHININKYLFYLSTIKIMTHGSVQQCATGIFIYLIAISFIDRKMIRSSFFSYFFFLTRANRSKGTAPGFFISMVIFILRADFVN